MSNTYKTVINLDELQGKENIGLGVIISSVKHYPIDEDRDVVEQLKVRYLKIAEYQGRYLNNQLNASKRNKFAYDVCHTLDFICDEFLNMKLFQQIDDFIFPDKVLEEMSLKNVGGQRYDKVKITIIDSNNLISIIERKLYTPNL